MDTPLICPACHVAVKPTDYFCSNCGKNLHPQALSTSISSQIFLYLKCLFLVPMGIFWGARYLCQPDRRSKIVGLIAVTITIISMVVIIQLTVSVFNVFSGQLSSQMQDLQGL